MSSKHLKILSLDLTYPDLSLEFFYEFLNRNAWIRVSRRFSFHRTPHPPLTPWTKMSWRTASGFFAQAHTTRSFSTARARSLHRCIPASPCAPTFLLSLLAPYAAASTHMPSSRACFAPRWSSPTFGSSHGRRLYVWMSLHPGTPNSASSLTASTRRPHPALYGTELRAPGEHTGDLHVHSKVCCKCFVSVLQK